MEAHGAESPKREEQVLVLAAAGMTDKEIALRLGISPDTVGTYWRRILAKFQAASRTEVVAKYAEERAHRAMDNLRYVNECLKLIADHMIEHGIASGGIGDAILASAGDWILLFDNFGGVLFSNRPVPTMARVADLFRGDDIPGSLIIASSAPLDVHWTAIDGKEFAFVLTPGAGSVSGHIVASGRSIS
jgi:DNA-binding CsgD family transcriptional regulator